LRSIFSGTLTYASSKKPKANESACDLGDMYRQALTAQSTPHTETILTIIAIMLVEEQRPYGNLGIVKTGPSAIMKLKEKTTIIWTDQFSPIRL
jgi:hypothetical protein